MHIALLYFGKSRSIRHSHETHYEHIFAKLKEVNITYDVFMHTWDTSENRIWQSIAAIPEDEESYSLLHPAYFKKDDQGEFLKTIKLGQFFYNQINVADIGKYSREWLFDSHLIQNHLCALESQRRVFQMCEEAGIHYDAYVILRPDAFFESDIDIDILRSIEEGNVYIPDWDHWLGYNDRFAFGSKEAIRIYTNRGYDLAEFRKTYGPLTSEKGLKLTLIKYGLEMRPLCIRFKLCRPNGTLS